MPQLPEEMWLSNKMLKKAKLVIPKFHLHNHGVKCHLCYNLNFLRYSAQSDYEDPERWWAHINPISMSTQEMTQGSRFDTINDHAAGWNWRKITGFGKCSCLTFKLSFTIAYLFLTYSSSLVLLGQQFKKNLTKALEMRTKSRRNFREFDNNFPEHIVNKWENMVEEWDKDMSQPNPYAEPIAGNMSSNLSHISSSHNTSETSMTEVLLELAREEDLAMNEGQPQIHKTSPAGFLKQGMQVENDQYTHLND